MKNSEIYKAAIQAFLAHEESTETELSDDDFREVLYKLTQDWYWSRYAEKGEEAKAKEADHD